MKQQRVRKRLIGVASCMLLLLLTACARGAAESAKEDVTIRVWTYYNGPQLSAFDSMVAEFNETVGKEEGITVVSANLGSVTDLETAVMNAAEGKVGADEMPHIFSAYADTAYAVDRMGLLANLDDYLTESEKEMYIENFLDEGRLSEDGALVIFPVAKSTELLLINETDFAPFAAACDVSYNDLVTMEGLVAVAEQYYDYSGGKALFGRDSMANYFLVGASQMGVNIIDVKDGKTEIHFDKEVVRRLWDCYYIPYIKGFFASSGRFRSDDLKTGNILCYVGSSASATYFPDSVVIDDTDQHDISLKVLAPPQFADGKPFAVQQGAGMVVTKSDAHAEAACVRFLTWFTEEERNIRFALESAYMPVTKASMSMDAIRDAGVEVDVKMEEILSAAIDEINNNTLYTQKAFAYGTDAREVLEYALSDKAAADREKVVQAVSRGMEMGAALAPYTSDDNFDTWYEETYERLQMLAEEGNRN